MSFIPSSSSAWRLVACLWKYFSLWRLIINYARSPRSRHDATFPDVNHLQALALPTILQAHRGEVRRKNIRNRKKILREPENNIDRVVPKVGWRLGRCRKSNHYRHLCSVTSSQRFWFPISLVMLFVSSHWTYSEPKITKRRWIPRDGEC